MVLLGDAIRAFPGGVLRGLDLLTSLTSEDADKAAHRVRLPARGFHYLGQRGAFGALHQRDNFGLFVGTVRLRPAVFLVRPGFFCGLGFLGGFAPALRLCAAGSDAALFSDSIVVIRFSFAASFAVVTFITPAGRNSK